MDVRLFILESDLKTLAVPYRQEFGGGSAHGSRTRAPALRGFSPSLHSCTFRRCYLLLQIGMAEPTSPDRARMRFNLVDDK
jgi:hypothetical protein